MSAFAVLLRRSLADAGMSQMDLARAVGTSSSVVSQACTGQRPPPLGRIETWAQALRLTSVARDAFLAAAELAHAPETVRQRVERLEQRLQDDDGIAWDAARPKPVVREEAGVDDGMRTLLPALSECRARAQGAPDAVALPDVAWEVHALVETLLLRLVDDAPIHGEAARKVRRHLERAAIACRSARPTRPASLRSALRQVVKELTQAGALIEQGAVPPRRRGTGR